MTLQFESPGKLEERIAANMADESDDLSLGVGRRAPSFASISISTDENSMSRGPVESYTNTRDQHSPWTYSSQASQRQMSNSTMRSAPSRTSILTPRDTNTNTHRSHSLAGKGIEEQSFSISSDASAASESASNIRVRSPPLTSTPHPSSLGQRTMASSSSVSHHSTLSRRNGSGINGRSSSSLSRGSSTGFGSALDGISDTKRSAKSNHSPEHSAPLEQGNDDSGSIAASTSRTEEDEEMEQDGELGSQAATGTMHTSDFVDNSLHSDVSQSNAVTKESESQPKDESPRDVDRPAEEGTTAAQPALSLGRRTPVQGTQIASSSPRHGPVEGTSTPKASRPDQERMKAYLINTVKTVNPLREAQLRHMSPRQRIQDLSLGKSPLPGPSRLRLGDEATQDDESGSFVSDVSSTRDLTMPAHFAARANSSLPGVGAGDVAGPSNARVDPVRLQGYLHKINVQLENENVSLKEEKEALKRQFNRALMDCERLRMQLEAKADAPKKDLASLGTMTSDDEMERLRKEVEDLRTGNEELNDMLDEREAALEAAMRKEQHRHSSNGEVDDRVRELEEELAEERQVSDQHRAEFQVKIAHAMEEALANEKRLTKELDEAWAEVDKVKLTSARTEESIRQRQNDEEEQEHYRKTQAALDHAREEIEALEQRIDEDTAALDELEVEYLRVKEDLMRCEDELSEAKDQVMDLQIAAEEKESDRIKLSMQLRQAKESTELQQLREKVLLLEAQLAEAMAKPESSSVSIRQPTPMPKKVTMLRQPVETPKSPAELSSASWLNHESTIGDKSVLRNLHSLRAKVDEAHALTDEKLANLGTESLAQRLVQMQDEVQAKEDEIVQMREKEARWLQRLERIRCNRCKTRLGNVDFDQSIMTRASMSTMTDGDASMLAKSTRSAHQKEQIVSEIAEQLNELKAKWAIDQARLNEEREALDAEKQVWSQERMQLQSENRRLRVEKESRGRESKENLKRMQEGTLKDLSRARRIIGEFERELREDCARFNEAIRNSQGLDEDGLELERELQRTKGKLQQVEAELKSKVETFERLQMELFEKSQMDRNLPLHVQLLELEVQKFSLEVESLRNERNSILEERQKLYKRHREHQSEYLNMHQELEGARQAMSAHQAQLDEQIETIERLHGTLTAQSKDLEVLHDDRDRLKTQRKEILIDVASLEGDLRRVREESQRFGRDLEKLRGEQEHTRREAAKEDDGKQIEDLKRLQQGIATLEKRETAIRSQHHAECEGLLLQIRYEKAKFMRESDLRSDLVQQKAYVLAVLEGMEQVDAGTTQFLADIKRSRRHLQGRGQTMTSPSLPSKTRKFKAVACAVLAICRARLMARHWKETTEVKQALRNAHKAAKSQRLKENGARAIGRPVIPVGATT